MNSSNPEFRFYRQPQIELLEHRLALDGEGVLLGGDAHLSLSFAPDGTLIAGTSSALFEKFGGIASEAEWQSEVLRAFQTWAVNTNADVGVVSDSGDAFGSPGAARRDDRFGDIRIGAAPMAPNIGAISVPINTALGGTWYADVIFNSDFDYQSLDDIFAIALHEAGNVFGLEDNDDPNSPMRAGPIPTATIPTANDIANLQALHGTRAPDANELDDEEATPNNTMEEASELDFGGVGDEQTGTAPGLIYGDIQSSADVDWFSVAIPTDYAEGLTVQVRSTGIGLLRPTVTLFDSSGALLISESGVGSVGSFVELNIPSVTAGERYFAKVESGDDLFGVGGYSLVAVLDSRNTVSQDAIDAAADGSLRFLDADDLEEVFDPNDEFFANDLGANDSPVTATNLNPSVGISNRDRFVVVGSISQPGDVDYYEFSSPEAQSGTVAYVALQSIDRGRLIPKVSVFNSSQQLLPSRVLVNGSGEYLIEVESVTPDTVLLVRVEASDTSSVFNVGNYSMTIDFAPSAVQLETFAQGELSPSLPQNEQALHVAEPQLFHFALSAGPLAGDELAAVVMQIVSDQGEVVHQIAAPPGETRSAGAAFLPIGEYTIRVTARSLSGAVVGPIAYEILGSAFSDPFVGDGSDPTTNPFECQDPELAGFFCYPGDIISSDPFLWDDFVDSLPDPPPPLDLTDLVQVLLGDWWSWVWATSGTNGMPLAVDDEFSAPPVTLNLLTTPDNVLANDIEPEGEPMVALLASGPSNGRIDLDPNGHFVYTPDLGFGGVDQFTYIAFDFHQESNPASVSIMVVDPAAVAGDYDRDSDVDHQDYDFWKTHYGATSGIGLQADGNGDRIVNLADYSIWRDNLGAVANGGAATPQVNANKLSSTPLNGSIATLSTDETMMVTSSQPLLIFSMSIRTNTLDTDLPNATPGLDREFDSRNLLLLNQRVQAKPDSSNSASSRDAIARDTAFGQYPLTKEGNAMSVEALDLNLRSEWDLWHA